MGFVCELIARFCRVPKVEEQRHTTFLDALKAAKADSRKRPRPASDAEAIARVIRDLDAAVAEVTGNRVGALTSKFGIEFHCPGTGRSETVVNIDLFDSFPLTEKYRDTLVRDADELRDLIIERIGGQRYEHLVGRLMSFDPGPMREESKSIIEIMEELKTAGYLGLGSDNNKAVLADLTEAVSLLNTGLESLTEGDVTAALDSGGIAFRTHNGMLSFVTIGPCRSRYPLAIADTLVGNQWELADIIKRRMTVVWHTPEFQSLVAQARNPSF